MTSVYAVVVAAVAGFLTRPCCVLPTVMSVAGMGSAGLAHVIVVYRSAFLVASVLMLACSLWLTFRRQGGWLIKSVSAGATLVAFYLSRGTL
jgi:hypothetical protein